MAQRALFIAGFALSAWSLCATPAAAQLAAGGGPIAYSADSLEYFDGERRLVLTGNVDVVQGDSTLRSNQVTLFFAQGSGGAGAGGMASGDIQRMIAEGDVFYVRPQQRARGNRAVYETSSDSVTFTGNVVIQSDSNTLRGETLTMQISSGRTTLAPGSRGRVQGVFRPRSSSRPPAQNQ